MDSHPRPDGEPGGVAYHPEDAEVPSAAWRRSPRTLLARLRWSGASAFWTLWVNVLAAWPLVPRRVRRWMLRRAGMQVATIGISGGCHFTPGDVHIGRDVYINDGLFADARGGIRIGDRVAIGPRVMLISSTHEFGTGWQRCAEHRTSPVVICDGSAIGAGSAVHAGVTVGAGCVIAAGSVVIRDCEPNSVYAGVPARWVRALRDD